MPGKYRMSTLDIAPTTAHPVVNKNYTVNLSVQVKRSKEELDFALKETDRLHELIKAGAEVEWAKARIEALHKMVFSPCPDSVKSEMMDALKKADL